MQTQKVYRAIGLMSGTSLDGVDMALIETDGISHVKLLAQGFYPYDDALKQAVRQNFGLPYSQPEAEELITQAHIKALNIFAQDADVIGFHGQTVWHDPDQGVTLQIGNGQKLADASATPVVYDMRRSDMAHGGQGAPLLPLYHRALVDGAAGIDLPTAVINIGGVANITWVAGPGDDQITAFDCGPGNALMDDYIARLHPDQSYDEDGKLAASGIVDETLVAQWLDDPYFLKNPPKSLDRDHWAASGVEALNAADAMASLCEFTARSIVKGLSHVSQKPKQLILTGGGRQNGHLVKRLSALSALPVYTAENYGWNGDSMEAEGFAYLAVRSINNLSLTLPGTTGVSEPCPGGQIAEPASKKAIAL